MDVIKADAAKAKAVLVADASKVKTAVVTDASDAWKAVSTDLVLDGKKCGTNPICQELAQYGVNVNHHIDHLVIKQWLKTGQYGQWCASSKICMDAVKEAQHEFTKGEKQAVNKWLHPAHTTESLLQELSLWSEFKAEAAKAATAVKTDATKALHWTEGAAATAGHDLMVAG
jgi:hypothetical protein